MNIALIGYGKMGQAIEAIAVKRGHNITMRIRSNNKHEMTHDALQHVDVGIEFTNPESARANVEACLKATVPVVCGTTGWNHGLNEVKFKAIENKTAFLQASNFSIGVNIFFEVNKLLAHLMNGQQDYDISIEETHHTQKKDAPSGTAITLAEQILDRVERKNHWVMNERTSHDTFPITAHRVENVPGTHNVKYTSAIDEIEIIHTAFSREGFAMGAVLAAEFIAGKSGIFTMADVLGINK